MIWRMIQIKLFNNKKYITTGYVTYAKPCMNPARPHIRDLEILLAVVTSLKATAAAHRLGISQPAVSKSIARLESQMGLALFERRGRALIPTPRALALAEEAESILTSLDRIIQALPQNDATRTLRIAGPPTLMHLFLPPLIAGFSRIETGVRIQIEIGKTPDVIAAVADGLADVGISDSPVNSSALRPEILRRTLAHVLVPKDHHLANRKQLGVADLADEPLIALARRFPARARLDQLFQDGGHVMRIVAETTTAASAYELVRQGMGVSVLNPFPLPIGPDSDFIVVPFVPSIVIETNIFSAAMGPTSVITRRFIDYVKQHQPPDPFGHTRK